MLDYNKDHRGEVVFGIKTTALYSLAHRLHTLTAVLRPTQPSTICEITK